MNERIDIGVLGATGTVGERLVRLVHDHPWFNLREVGASDRSAGMSLGEALSGSDAGPLPDALAELELKAIGDAWESPLLLSALPSVPAREVEARLAEAGHLVVSNASSYRADPSVPLVVPEINADHLGLVRRQRERWEGGIVTNPNCSVAGLAVALHPLHETFGLERVVVTTFQAISGAGRPGPPAADLVDNVIPHIGGEEDKIAAEPRKILGTLTEDGIRDADFRVSATATRVAVLHGHLAAVSVAFRNPASPEDVLDAFRHYRGGLRKDALPSAPPRPLVVVEGDARPQPRLDRERGRGMTVSVGRVRRCEVQHVKLVVLSHNLVRGAAGAALLNAELCHARGLTARARPAAAGPAAP